MFIDGRMQLRIAELTKPYKMAPASKNHTPKLKKNTARTVELRESHKKY